MTPKQFNGLICVLIKLFIVSSGLYLMIRGVCISDPLLYCAGLGGLWLQGRFTG